MKLWAKFTEETYALLRIMAGFMISMHGTQKIFGVLANQRPSVGSQVWMGGLIEVIGGLCVLFGFRARWAAFIASGMMAEAYFQFHWKFRFDSNFFPLVNHGELAVLYCFVFLFIAARGSGKWSLDGVKG